jgi:hypothetical protein
MRMNKTVHKLRPSDYWRIGEHESWFADMAAEGYHLKKMKLHFVQFVKGEPKKMRYRIDVSMDKKIAQEQIQMYAESGWEYVTSYNYFHVFSSPVELNAPELHTDPAEQSYTLKDLDKKLAMNASIGLGALILMVGMLISILYIDGNPTPTYLLVEGMAIQQTILTFFIGFTSYTSLQAAISIRTLRKALLEGKSIDHHAPWKKRHRVNSTLAFFFTVIVGLTAIIPFVQLVKMDTKTLPAANIDLPFVRLADIENNSSFIRGESYMIDEVDWGNRYSTYWSPLATMKYETDENGVVPGEMWKDGSGQYSPSIQTRVYQLSFPSMSDNLIADLIKRYRFEEREEKFVEKEHPNFDLLIVHEDNPLKEVYASKGKAVIHVRYYGYADINSVIEKIGEKLLMIKD